MISIVIPVYNAATFLPHMLESIIGQSYKDIEILLINDGSTDNSSSICHDYAGRYSFIHVFDRKNQGPAAARNFGMQQASGEFIWFMDSDDELEKDALQRAIEEQRAYDADVVIGGMNFCFTEVNRAVPKLIQNELILDSNNFSQQYKMLYSANYISSMCNKLIRRAVLSENNIHSNESLWMYEDYVFCMDTLLKCKRVVCTSEIYYNYKFRNSNSLSHRYRDDVLDMFRILENKITGYKHYFGTEHASANASLNNLLIYLAYECVKNEARHKKSYAKIRTILHDDVFHHAVSANKATGFRYRIVQIMMRYRMSFALLIYCVISKKV